VVEQQAIEIGRVARGLVPMLERLLGEDVELELTVADDAGAVLADHGQLEQVLVNLAVNAGDAMPGGGRLLIGVDATDVDEGLAHARLELEPGRYVVLTVSDTGVGIDAETQNHIFEPFFTTKPPDQGTGLGLSTVFGIVKQGGGSITVYSESGHGTTFRVYLPRTEEVPERALRPPPRLPREIAAPGGTILVVDDERVVRRVVARMLERSGYTVLTAGDGPEALEISDTHDGRIDLLLTDMVLPGMPGPEVAELLTSRRPETRVLFSSGYPGDEITRRGLNADSPYLEKPFSHETLSLVVSGLLEGDAQPQ
jgi:CheY-like chemotaxis protein